MNTYQVNKILTDTAYVRLAGSTEEKKCADYIVSLAEKMGGEPIVEKFPVSFFSTEKAKLTVDGKEIPCTAYLGSKSDTIAAKLYYLQSLDKTSFKKCKDKIVILDKNVNFELYSTLVENGVKGIITYNGNLNFADKDIDTRRISFQFEKERLIPAVNVHISDAFEIIKKAAKIAKIEVLQNENTATSQNVIVDIKGKTDETILISAHYDTTSLSVGAYDNMSSCIGLFNLLEHFSKTEPYYTIRLLWCGSEESGLIGSLEYCKKHESELSKTILNINLDMLGSVMGEFNAFSCIDEKMKEFLERFFKKHRFGAVVKYGIRSSDSNSFVLFGVPAVSFARYAPSNIGAIHTRYDTKEIILPKQLLKDMKNIALFCEHVANTPELLNEFSIGEKIKEDIKKYFNKRARPVWLCERRGKE